MRGQCQEGGFCSMRPEMQTCERKCCSQCAGGRVRAGCSDPGGHGGRACGFQIEWRLSSVHRQLQTVCKCLLMLADELRQRLQTIVSSQWMLSSPMVPNDTPVHRVSPFRMCLWGNVMFVEVLTRIKWCPSSVCKWSISCLSEPPHEARGATDKPTMQSRIKSRAKERGGSISAI